MQEEFLLKKINERKAQDAYRELRLPEGKTDFTSNDYLGIVRHRLLEKEMEDRGTDARHRAAHGATGSRLLSGNYELIVETEQIIADFHEAEAGLIFNSGYDANLGLLSCVPQRGDTILYDQLCHASLRDGIRLSFAQAHAFAHNDLADLESKLGKASGNIFIVTESVFSMDGDMAPLAEIVSLSEKYHAHLILDEAHATGVIGKRGEGLLQQLNLHQPCFARVHTFGKALGCHGAIVLGSATLRRFLINFARPFIYTTALPPASAEAIRIAYALIPGMQEERDALDTLVRFFRERSGDPDLDRRGFKIIKSETPVQALIIPGNAEARKWSRRLASAGLDIRPILYPTVPKGSERLRMVLHSFNTVEEIEVLFQTLRS